MPESTDNELLTTDSVYFPPVISLALNFAGGGVGALVCVKAERPMTKVKRPNVIKSENVIGVTMRDENCIQVLQSFS